MKNENINPYDLEQVGRIRKETRSRLRFFQKDPYDLSSRVYEKRCQEKEEK